MSDSLGDRMKRYENVYRLQAIRRLPLIVRVDGRAFHSLTRSCEKPFDKNFINAMVTSALFVAEEMQGFRLAYVQSDEVTFYLSDTETLETQPWFDNTLFKIVSIAAALMSVEFTAYFLPSSTAVFDARAFTVPPEEVTNCFLWRAKDWERNSLQMYARSFFSHKELHLKNREAIHEMLHSIGKNWATDLSEQEKNGTFIQRTDDGYMMRCDVLPTFQAINELIAGEPTHAQHPTKI